MLQRLYARLSVPPEVTVELDQAGSMHTGWRQQLGLVRVAYPPVNDPVPPLLTGELDPGEAAAIALAKREGAGPLVIDNLAARRLAWRMGLSITGTLGVVAAADRHCVDDPFTVLYQLRDRGAYGCRTRC